MSRPQSNEAYLVVELTWMVELSQELIGQPFEATLIRQETRQFDGDPMPDIVESTEARCQTEPDLTGALAAVDRWLLAEHHMRILPQSWRSRPAEGTTGLTVLLEGRATTARRSTAQPPTPRKPACHHPMAS